MSGLLDGLDALITSTRVLRWTATCLACQLTFLAVAILATHGAFAPLEHPSTTDFVSFYAAGSLANGSQPMLVYSRAAHYLAEQAATSRGVDYVYFFYPPTYLLICSALSRLPYLAAFVIFVISTCVSCLLVIRLVVGGGRGWWLPIASFSPLLWTIGIGQNACLSAAIFGLATLLLHQRRQMAAGLIFACLLFKPHLGLLVPVALAASGSWRAFVAASFGVCGLTLVTSLIFGLHTWLAFTTTILDAQSSFASGHVVPFAATASIFGAARMLGSDERVAFLLEGVVGLIVVAAIIWSWRKPDAGTGVRYATLIAGTQLIMPVVLFYDTVLLLIASAWLVRAARLTGFYPGERSGLAAIWLGGLLCYPASLATHLPIASAMAIGMFALALHRQGKALPASNEHRSLSFAESRSHSATCGSTASEFPAA